MASVNVRGSPNWNDIFKTLKPSDFGNSTSVETTSTSIAYQFLDGLDDWSLGVENTFHGNFSYTYGPGSQIATITGMVTSLSYSYSYREFSPEDYSFYEGFSISGINVDVADFQTMTPAAIMAQLLSGDDTIRGSTNSDSLDGFAGDDILDGNGGADFLNGGTGADIMIGGSGNTTYEVDNAFDAVIEFFGGGTDTVYSSINYTLGQAVDRLTLTETAISGTGNEMANRISGNSMNNVLNGRDGDDDLRGGTGDDVLIGSYGADKLDGGAGSDAADYSTSRNGLTVSLLSSKLNTGDAQGDTYKAIENLTGSGFADSLFGNNGANQLRGGNGNDGLTGYNGNDQLYGDAGNDVLIGGGGADALFGGAGTDTASYASAGSGIIASLANGSINTGDAAADTYVEVENLTGSAFDDYLYGNSGNNVIDGGAGNDILKGYAGNDHLIGNSGDDVFMFNTALNTTTNVDSIQGYNVADDAIWLDDSVFKSLATGTLSASAFRIGSAAADASDRIIYDSSTGKVSYDIDGAGGAGAIQFALLSKNLALTYADFIVV